MKYLTVEKLPDQVFCITDATTAKAYLIVGEEKAALLDTGVGFKEFGETVRKLTNKPIEVYLTHGHVDHAGGIFHFDKVHVHPDDIELMKIHTKRDYRVSYSKCCVDFNEYPFEKSDFIVEREVSIETILPGDQIDLGNRILTVVGFAGHTQGSVGYYDESTDTLFAGDGCNNSTFMFLEHSSTVESYKRVLEKIQQDYGNKMKKYIISHGYIEAPLTCIQDVIECCNQVLQGNYWGESFQVPFEPIRVSTSVWAREGMDNRKGFDGKFGNMIFDTRKVND